MARHMEPTVQAMVLCERTHHDPESNRHTLTGILREISFKTFPADLSCSLYLNLVADHPPGGFVVRLVRLPDDAILFDIPVTFGPLLPPHYVEFTLTMPSLAIGSPGAYSFDLLWGPHSKPLASWRLHVHHEAEEPV